MYYLPTLSTLQITIDPKTVDVATLRADKVYDGSASAA